MTADAQDYALEISEPLFRLTTESIHLRSNETQAHESLSSLTLHLLSGERDLAAYDTHVLRQHLDVLPSAGDLAILLSLPASCGDRLEAVRTDLENRVGRRLTSEDAISLLLFDYVVERKAARVLGMLGLADTGGPETGGSDMAFSH